MNRRSFSTVLAAGTAASLIATQSRAATTAPLKARNAVLVHGLFADGSCWSDVIPLLQAAGMNVTSVQNPLTTLPDAVAAALRVLDRQDGPTLLVGHSFSRDDRHPSRHASQCFRPGLYSGARPRCTEDRTINPDLERFKAKRMGATTIEIASSHVSMISHPDIVASLILKAAAQNG